MKCYKWILKKESPKIIFDIAGIVKLDGPLEHSTLLDELLFWLVKFEFPQKLVTLLLVLLPNDEYKVW